MNNDFRIMAKRHLEKAFQSEWTKAVKQYMRLHKIDFVYRKPPDNAFVGNYRLKNYYDCYVRFNKMHWSMELKLSKTIKVINFKTLFKGREDELDYLEAEKKAGGISYVIINQYNKKHRINRVFAITIANARKYHDQEQIKIEEIEKNNLEIKKKETFWDLTIFFT